MANLSVSDILAGLSCESMMTCLLAETLGVHTHTHCDMQVINHDVPGQVMGEMTSSAEEFFGLPTEEKMLHYSTDSKKLPRFHTSIGNEQEKLLYRRDCLKLGCYPLEQFRQQWPQKPARLR